MNHSAKGNVAEIEPLNKSNNNNNNNDNATLLQNIKRHLMQNLLLVLTIIGIFAGIGIGFLGRLYKPSPTAVTLITFPGEMLLRVLKMLILPLIISSLITGLAQLDPKSSGKMGSRALCFYVLTTMIATITGINFLSES
jgi:solute carrier family 1 (high affinity glutamate transporter) protein 2